MDDRYQLPDIPQQVTGLLLLAVLILLVLFFPLIAALVAPDGRRGTFFLLTFLLILPGPFGVACAAIAHPRIDDSERRSLSDRLFRGDIQTVSVPRDRTAPPPPESDGRL
jgi:hypothetical protein